MLANHRDPCLILSLVSRSVGPDPPSGRSLLTSYCTLWRLFYACGRVFFKEYLHLLFDIFIYSYMYKMYLYRICPRLPSNTFMSSFVSVHLVWFTYIWVWCHPLEYGQLTNSHTPEEKNEYSSPSNNHLLIAP